MYKVNEIAQRFPGLAFTREVAIGKAGTTENNWSAGDPAKVALAYAVDTQQPQIKCGRGGNPGQTSRETSTSIASETANHTWPDSRLILAVQSDPPDEAALEVLAARYWDPVFIRCRMLTLNHEQARDLAQATWCRLLRKRHMLMPDGNLCAYLATIAMNLFRDTHRSARRAGSMADHRLLSLEAEFVNKEGKTVCLREALPDLSTLRADEQAQLKIDIREALDLLPPLLREVIVARFIAGESCLEIAHRHGRTEQTISGWVRKGIREMKAHLDMPSMASAPVSVQSC